MKKRWQLLGIRNQSKLDMAKSMGLISESEYGGYEEIISEAVGTDKMEALIESYGSGIRRAKDATKEIKKIMKENPTISANEIAEMLNVKAEAVRYRIKLMKKSGEVTRSGATKAGKWKVIK